MVSADLLLIMTIQFPNSTRQASLAFAFAVLLLDVLGFGILVPVIPALVGRFSDSALSVGLLSTFYAIAAFFSAPILGSLSDQYGRRPLLLICIFGSACAWLIFGLANSLWLMFAARILDGLTGGNIAVVQAYIADISTPENRTKNFALIGTAFGLGFVIGPAIGGWLSHFGLTVPAFVGASCSLAAVFVGLVILPESLKAADVRVAPKLSWQRINPLVQLIPYLRQPALIGVFMGTFAVAFAMNVLRSYFGVFAKNYYHLNPQQIAHLFVVLGASIIVVQGVLVRVASKYVPERLTFLIAAICILSGFGWYAMLPPAETLYYASIFIAIGQGLLMPLLTTQLSKRVGTHEQGVVLGANQSVLSVAMIIAPFMAGLAADHLGLGAPFLVSAIILILGLLLAFRFDQQHRRTVAAHV